MRLTFLINVLIVITLSVTEIFAGDLIDNGKMYYSRGDFRKAADAFEMFVRAHPDSAEGYEWLGRAYFGLGDNEFASDTIILEKAVVAFRKVLSLNPENSTVRFNLGMVYVSLDDKTEAIGEYEQLKGRDKELANRLLEGISGHSFSPVYRAVGGKDPEVTNVTILGNQVLVPVILGKDGNEVRATLLLDTGATVTSINSDVAERLRINAAQTQKMTGQVAGGGLLSVHRARLSYISVGPHTKSGLDVAIVEQKGPPVPYEGLLGMNFLRELRYTIDFQNRTINWRP